MPKGKREWLRFAALLIGALVLLMWPWPGLPAAFASGFRAVANPAMGVVFAWAPAAIHFEPSTGSDPHPWWVVLSVVNTQTDAAFHIPVDTRTLVYLRIAVYVALAAASPLLRTRPGRRALLAGFAAVVVLILVTLTVPILQVMGIVEALSLGFVAQSILSIGILTLITYPEMAFVVPGAAWWLATRLARA